MHSTPRTLLLAAACIVGAACHDSTKSNGDLTATATDSIGDTFGSAGRKQWDISSLEIVRDTGGVTITLAFTTNVILPTTGDTTAMIGDVEFDVDQSAATGDTGLVDHFRNNSGSTGMGVDYVLDLFDINADSTIPVFDSTVSVQQGVVKATVSGNKISARIPRSMLGGDDGYLNAAAIVGTQHEPTDIVPNNGHLHVGGIGADIVSAERVEPVALPGRAVQRHWPMARRQQ